MDVKPTPKPRTLIAKEAPIPAPRIFMAPPTRSRTISESDKSDESKSQESKSTEFLRSLGSSSRQLKNDISEKMTAKGKAVISSTKNASIRLEKSVKHLLTRRLTNLTSEDQTDGDDPKPGLHDDRCVSLSAGDEVFNSISFYSPLHGNLKHVDNEEDLSRRYSPPPPVYPPPPPPDESIYDELQSVTSVRSSRFNTMSSDLSERVGRDFCDDATNSSPRTMESDSSDRSSSYYSDAPRSEILDLNRKLFRSDSWSFYDATPTSENGHEKDLNDLDKRSLLEEIEAVLQRERTSCTSDMSSASLVNSLYENWFPAKISPVADAKRGRTSKSVILEFDPFASGSPPLHSDNNDLLLLKTLLATSDSQSSNGSTNDLMEDLEEDDLEVTSPPSPPRRYDSLPKHEYDEVEIVSEDSDKAVAGKNPALLPKLAHLAKKKKPAVPPRKGVSAQDDGAKVCEVSGSDCDKLTALKSCSEERKSGMMHKLKRFTHESTSYVKPNVMSFVRQSSFSKFLVKHKENSADGNASSSGKFRRMERPKIAMNENPPTHKGVLYKSGAGIEKAKDLVARFAVLLDQKVAFYTDQGMGNLKEVIQLAEVKSLHLLQDVK